MSAESYVKLALRINLESGCDRFTIAEREGALYLEWRDTETRHFRKISENSSESSRIAGELREFGFEVGEAFDTI